ncbi:MAG: hypothetical protein EZS28_019083 [Streblomastix strix]|uniref:Uncharacterized protein n=1 Tax=Streblomastix strix TaxID=222440 RepID=A0A5J4VS52_9EUKA|nr:MAG: hypothetical protein EZS28_019083 [Streblomastix strix]
MIVDSGFFVIQQSKKAQLIIFNIEFIGQGTVKQEGLALLSIKQSSFKLSNNISTISPFIQAIRGQPAIQTSSQCTNIKFKQTIFSNLHSIITNGEQKASGAVIEMGQKTEVEFTDCTFIHCIDSSSDIQHSTGAVCIILKSSDTLINQLSDEQTIQSTISFNQCQFTGCIGGSSGAIQSISNQSKLNLRLNIIIDKCNFDNCGNDNSIVGACWFNGQNMNNNYGQASVTNSHFSNNIGQQVGGILFGDNINPMNVQCNTFSNNSKISTSIQGATDIFFSSKKLLDSAGGIKFITKGYKNEQDNNQNSIKIKEFTSNFAQYLDCITRNDDEEQCGEIPCRGELNIQAEQCEYVEDQDEDECLNVIGKSKQLCPCLLNDPRDICKQLCIPTSEKEITEECPCYAVGDPRSQCQKLCKPTIDTPIEQCECLAVGDPRSQCQKLCKPTIDTPIEQCECLAVGDPRSQCQKLCKPTIDTPIEQCEFGDPRSQCQKLCKPTIDTPIEQCECLAVGDPRLICKKACIPTYQTSIEQCGCLEINDPRYECQKSCVPTTETAISECGCLIKNDPREECQKACIPTYSTPISECGCLALNDPQIECKIIVIPTYYTPVTESSPCLFNNDPRSECKQQCIPSINTPVNECPCLEMNDPRLQCQKSCIPTPNTPIDECCCFDIDDPREECKEKIQAGIEDEKEKDQTDIDKDQVEDKKQGLSALVIALIGIASVSVIITVISIEEWQTRS